MGRASFLLSALSLFALSFFSSPTHQANTTNNKRFVDIGVVLDMGTMVGKISKLCLEMGLEDFYAAHPDYTTRLALHVNDSGNYSVGAASAALYLMKNLEVQAILGPQRSSQASFVIDLGSKAHVPIVSFTVNTPTFSQTKTPYFIRTATNSQFQVGALAAIIKKFGWKSVSLIFEDTDYGTALMADIMDAFQAVDARVGSRTMIPPSAADVEISKELYRLMTMQTRVFVVHMLPPLSSRLFSKVRSLGMMTEGYVWIITETLTDLLTTSTLDSPSESMEGVLGVKTYVNKSKDLDGFHARWQVRLNQEYPQYSSSGKYLSINGLRAYDTAQAMATAVEHVGGGNLEFQVLNSSNDPNVLSTTLGLSKNGPRLREAILNTKLESMGGGMFHLVDGQLPASPFEIVNFVPGGWNEVGLWRKEEGILMQQLNSNSTNMNVHDIVIWPGDSHDVPKGWEIPTNGKVFLVGVPIKKGFLEFVNANNTQHVTGYCIDIFDAVIKSLPYSVRYKYKPYKSAQTPGSYNGLIDQVYNQEFDAVVGDVTIIANRSLYVDFTLPFTESGVSMVVPVSIDGGADGWIFLKPLSKELWLGTLAFFFLTGLVVWFIEHRVNADFRGDPVQQMGTIFYFAFSTMVFAHNEKMVSNFSKLVLIIWLFFVLILTSSYTASLTSMLTVQRLNPSVTDVKQLTKNNESVGYQDGSFVRELLIHKLNFSKSQLRNYTTPQQYAEALSKGSRNGGVSAIFDEIPYIKVFLKGRCKQYTMVGPTYKTDGFGFVFPKRSPLVSDMSSAVLNVTQGEKMNRIESAWFGDQTSCPVETNIYDSNRLRFTSFWGLFLITGLVSVLSMAFFFAKFWYVNSESLKGRIAAETSLWGKVSTSMKHFDDRDGICSSLESHKDCSWHQGLQMGRISTMTSRDTTPPCATPYADGSRSPPAERCGQASMEVQSSNGVIAAGWVNV